MKYLLKIIYYLFIVAIAGIALMLLFSALPITGNIKVLTVLSGSMEPSIRTGSVVLVKPSSDYNVGDVITFGKISKTQIPITHRIVEIKSNDNGVKYVTKGDANEETDTKEVARSEIIGKVLFDVPYVGYAVNAARQPLGFLLIIVVPAGIIIVDEARKIIVEIGKMRSAKKKMNSEL